MATSKGIYAKRGSPLKDRLMFRVVKTPTCWNWTGTRIPRGYGMLGNAGRAVLVHRVSYEVHVGSIPKNLHVLHTCDNRLCVNPAHLFVGTNKDNMRDMTLKGRSNKPKGEDNGQAKLTEDEVIQIRNLDLSTDATAAIYGVGVLAIQRVRSRKTWKHL